MQEIRVNIYVGNLSFDAGEQDLQKLFEAYGPVTSATIIKDKMTGKSKGFGFVVMPDQKAAEAAIAGANGKDLLGRQIKVNEARPRA
jgi:RNA recognition motif-containing protein